LRELGVSAVERAKEKTGLALGGPGWNLIYNVSIPPLHGKEYGVIIERRAN